MSNRPAEHSDGDRSTRNAAFGAGTSRIWTGRRRDNLSHADFAPRSESDAFASTFHTFHAFHNVQPVASDRDHTALPVRALGVSAPGGRSRVVEVSTRHQRSVAPSTRTINARLWSRARPTTRRCAAAWLHR